MAKAPRAFCPPQTKRKTDEELAVAVFYDGKSVPLVACSRLGCGARSMVRTARRYGIPVRRDSALACRLEELGENEAVPQEMFAEIAGVLAEVLSGDY